MLKTWLKDAEKVAIAGHVRPDGDCMGSCLGLYNYLRENYKNLEISVYLEPAKTCFEILPGAEAIKHEIPENDVVDVFFALDSGDKERLGFAVPLFDMAKKTVCIDHHISNTAYADDNLVDPDASSASEMVYRLIKEQTISRSVAECLYLGIVHDTGVFAYSSTSPDTMRAAARLLETGIDGQALIDKTFFERSYAETRALGMALMNSFLSDGFIVSILTRSDMAKAGAGDDDLESIVNNLRMTRGTLAAVFLHETPAGDFKVSLRSGGAVDTSRVAVKFGGGGHKKASGLTLPDAEGSLKALLAALKAEEKDD